MIGEGLARRKIPIIGKGDALLACPHADDAADAMVTAAEGSRSGLWHVVDGEPVPVARFLGALADRLGAAPPRRAPVWLARLAAGRQAVEFFTSSTRTSNRLFRRAFGWTPGYPTIEEGLGEIAAAWKAEGFPPAGG